MPVPAIVLAAGASSRLGQPKQLVRIGNETLLARSLRVLRESGYSPIIAVLGARADKIEAVVDLTRIHTVRNAQWSDGIASSIHTGLNALKQLLPSASGVLLSVCDQPQLSSSHLAALADSFHKADGQAIAASQYGGVAGIPAVFPASLFDALLALEGDTGARALLRNPECAMIALPFEGGELDIDTPADLESLKREQT
jgi:molybdenum cofactor cytidylyltransferase